jgi:hypothetical protein
LMCAISNQPNKKDHCVAVDRMLKVNLRKKQK